MFLTIFEQKKAIISLFNVCSNALNIYESKADFAGNKKKLDVVLVIQRRLQQIQYIIMICNDKLASIKSRTDGRIG
jgi:hypothetical protein